MSSVKKEEYTLPGKGRLILTKDLTDQIDWLHDNAPKGKEWCGILFYRHIEGDINDPKSFVLQAEHLYLMDLGSEAYTDADIDIDAVIEMDEVIPDVRNLKKGLIHTHHSMSCFFSGTDMSELHDNVGFHNYYLSLIVNYSGEYVAKVAYVAKKTTTVEYRDVQDVLQSKTTEREVMAMIDMDLEWEVPEVSVADFFRARYEKLEQEKAAKVPIYHTVYRPGYAPPFGGSSQVSGSDKGEWNGRPQWDWDNHQPMPTRTKQIPVPFLTEEGDLQVGEKKLRPLSKVSKEIEALVRQWLEYGVALTKGIVSDGSIPGLLTYFSDYYEFGDNERDYPFFVNQMQRAMEDVFKGYHAKMVSEVGCVLLEPDDYEGNDICTDLYTMMDAFEEYTKSMKDIPKLSEFDKVYQKHVKAGAEKAKKKK